MKNSDNIKGWKRAAQVAGCSASQVRRLVQAGKLRAEKDGRGVHHFERADLEALRVDRDAEGPTGKPASKTGPVEPEEPAPAPALPAPPTAPAAGALAAEAFRLLDGGSGPADLVAAMEIEPAQAMSYFESWKTARAAGLEANLLRDASALLLQLQAVGWTCGDVLAAYAQVVAAREMYADAGFTSEDALSLLRLVRTRKMEFGEAVEALRHLPTIEEQELLTSRIKADARFAEQQTLAAQEALGRLQAETMALWPYAGWLRLAGALARLVEGGGDAVAQLRSALAVTPEEAVADELLLHADPADEATARQQLATWAARELPGLLILRDDHKDALARAENQRRWTDVALGVALARS